MRLTDNELRRIDEMFLTGNFASPILSSDATDQMMQARMHAEEMKVDAQMAAHDADQDKAAMDQINAADNQQAADNNAADDDADGGDADRGGDGGGGGGGRPWAPRGR